MVQHYLFITATLSLFACVYQANGLQCYNCHAKCPEAGEDSSDCEYQNIYLNTISYDRSHDGLECPTDYVKWNDRKLIEKCDEGAFCGKREISIHVKLSSEGKENVGVTQYPILDAKRIYHRVHGCMKPQTDCNRKTYDKVISVKGSSNNETLIISGKIVEEADCQKCQQDLCNAEESSTTNKPSNNLANKSSGSIIFWFLPFVFYCIFL